MKIILVLIFILILIIALIFFRKKEDEESFKTSSYTCPKDPPETGDCSSIKKYDIFDGNSVDSSVYGQEVIKGLSLLLNVGMIPFIRSQYVYINGKKSPIDDIDLNGLGKSSQVTPLKMQGITCNMIFDKPYNITRFIHSLKPHPQSPFILYAFIPIRWSATVYADVDIKIQSYSSTPITLKTCNTMVGKVEIDCGKDKKGMTLKTVEIIGSKIDNLHTHIVNDSLRHYSEIGKFLGLSDGATKQFLKVFNSQRKGVQYGVNKAISQNLPFTIPDISCDITNPYTLINLTNSPGPDSTPFVAYMGLKPSDYKVVVSDQDKDKVTDCMMDCIGPHGGGSSEYNIQCENFCKYAFSDSFFREQVVRASICGFDIGSKYKEGERSGLYQEYGDQVPTRACMYMHYKDRFPEKLDFVNEEDRYIFHQIYYHRPISDGECNYDIEGESKPTAKPYQNCVGSKELCMDICNKDKDCVGFQMDFTYEDGFAGNPPTCNFYNDKDTFAKTEYNPLSATFTRYGDNDGELCGDVEITPKTKICTVNK